MLDLSNNLTTQPLQLYGKWTDSQDQLVRIIVASSSDIDGDGIPDNADSCPNGIGEDEGWTSNELTDRDTDGCHDSEEDLMTIMI